MQNEQRAWRRVMREWEVGPASGLAEARRFVAMCPDKCHGWLALSHHLSELARYGESARALRKAERLASPMQRPRVWEQWGLMYRTKYDLPRAERWFRKALSSAPSTRRHVFLGATLARQGRLADALVEHRAAIALNSPDEPVDEAHLNAALVLRGLERYQEAHVHLKKAIALDPKYADARRTLRDIQRVLHNLKTAG